MRFKKTSGDFSIYAVAGTQTVLLSVDIPKSIIDGFDFLGFSFERIDKNNKKMLLNGTKVFDSLLPPGFTEEQLKAARKKSLVQSFFGKIIVLIRARPIPILSAQCLVWLWSLPKSTVIR